MSKKEEENGQYGDIDYAGATEVFQFNKNLLAAYEHEKMGIAIYTRFLNEAHDDRGREMYRKLIEEELHHLKMLEDEIAEHKKQGYWA